MSTASLRELELLTTREPLSEPTSPETQDNRRERSHLSLAPRPKQRLRPGAVAFASGIVAVVIIAAQLCLSILQTSDAYELDSLWLQKRDLSRVERVLQQNIESLSSPQNLAENAQSLGMVQNVQPTYLRLSDAAILGSGGSATEIAGVNSVPNITLESMPLWDESGQPVSRTEGQAAADVTGLSDKPVVWKGNLPAPKTH